MNRPTGGDGPPAAVRLLLRLLVPAKEREYFLGDLQESGRRGWLHEIAGAAALRIGRHPGRERSTHSNRMVFVIDSIVADLRLGFRRLVRAPAATLTALTALSVGIGLSAVLFSVISSAVLPTLPFVAGERIVRVSRVESAPVTAQSYEYWKERQRSFEGLGGWVERPVNLTIGGEGGEPVWSAALDANVLSLLSVRPALGRGFVEADAEPGAPAVVLLGHDVWNTRLNADPAVVGRMVRVNGEPAEVIGVLPAGFAFPWRQELWMPLRLDALRPDRNPEGLSVFGVLRAGVSRDIAAAELSELDRQRPRPAGEPEAKPVEVRAFTDIVNPAGQSQLLAGVLLGVALLVLLVACANATNVLLAQASVRAREVAVRSALGASRVRVARHFWTEVALLAFAGAAGGVLFAAAGLRLIRNAVPANSGMPFWIDFRIDVPVLVFVAASAVLAAMLAGVVPALHASRANRLDLLKDATRGTSSGRLGRLMSRLIGVELAVSFVLLVAAGLFVRSAMNLQRYDFTFGPEGVYTAEIRLPETGYDGPADRAALAMRLGEQLSAIPGASAFAIATALPGIGSARRTVAIEGVSDPADADLPGTWYVAASPGYFELFRAPVLAGRGFDMRDRMGALPVAIVNQAFAQRYLQGGAVGHRIALPVRTGDTEWLTIVGVVPDLLQGGLERGRQEAVYRPFAQAAPVSFGLAVRSSGVASAMAGPVREAVTRTDPDLVLSFMNTLDQAIDGANAQYRWMGTLFVVAGGLALFLAAIGLYGVMAFWVAQRTREIGVRMALGGGRTTIVRLVLRQAMTPIVLGVMAGVLLAAPAAWLMREGLLDVRPLDPLVFGTVAVVLLAAGCLGCILPALRATRVDPQVALASE